MADQKTHRDHQKSLVIIWTILGALENAHVLLPALNSQDPILPLRSRSGDNNDNNNINYLSEYNNTYNNTNNDDKSSSIHNHMRII